MVLQLSCLLVFSLHVDSCFLLLVEAGEERQVWTGVSDGLWFLQVLSWRLESTAHPSL